MKSPTSTEESSQTLKQLVYHKRCQIMIAQKWGILIANLGASVILLLVLYFSHPPLELTALAAIVIGITAYRLISWPKPSPVSELIRAQSNPYLHLIMGMTVNGLFWGAIGVLYFDASDPATSLVIIILLLAIVGGASAAHSPMLPAYALFSSLILVPAGVRIFVEPGTIYQVLGVGIIFSLLVFLHIASQLRDNITRVIILEHEKDQLVKQLKRSNDRLQHYSYIDSLTDIPNRRHYDEQVASMWNKGDDSPFPLSLIILDIDFFKQYNDTRGHLAGDAVLKHVAEVLVSFSDAGTGEVARIGGEEFSVLLPGIDAHKAFITADEIRRSVEQLEIEHGNSDIASVLTISAGVSTLENRSNGDAASLYAKADKALYEAKASGRNRVKAL